MDLGQGFTPRFGKVTEQMPALTAAGETPISMDLALQQQFAYPETWGNTYVFTGDGVATGTAGDILIDLDSALLLDVNPRSTLSNSALVLDNNRWAMLKENVENLYLTREQVEEANGKGYVKKGGVWQPENRSVAVIWYALGRGRNLRDHAELASEKSGGAEQVLNLYFDNGKRQTPTMRAWCVYYLGYWSNAFGNLDHIGGNGRLVGVAPEALKAAKRRAKNEP